MPYSDLRQRLLDWYDQPILNDANNIRNRATHSYYGKELSIQRWMVQKPNGHPPYGGPRWLVDYCAAVISHLENLPLDELRDQMRMVHGLSTTGTGLGQAKSQAAGA